MKFTASVFLLLLLAIMSFAETNREFYRVFDSKGNPQNVENIITKLDKTDVVFLGETHDDSVAHSLQFDIFKNSFEKYNQNRNVILSLEMFERDVQTVLDEYLGGLITETHFLASSRPWGNYKSDYRPLLEFAKENKLNVVAANAPRRYVNMVSRLGKDSLKKLSKESKKWMAPLPFAGPSKKYSDKFNSRMKGHGSANILQSQNFWDATMAYSISEQFKKYKDNLVIHLNGSFHTENRLGTVEQLQRYNPKLNILVVTMILEKDFKNFDKSKHTDLGDIVILTDSSQPRSKR